MGGGGDSVRNNPAEGSDVFNRNENAKKIKNKTKKKRVPLLFPFKTSPTDISKAQKYIDLMQIAGSSLHLHLTYSFLFLLYLQTKPRKFHSFSGSFWGITFWQ